MINHLLPSILARYPKMTEEQRLKTVQILQDVNKTNGGTGAFTLLGGMVVGAIVAATSTATLGIASGAGLIWLAVSNGLNYGHGMEFAKEHGCIAHLLNDRQLRKWQDIIGHKAVLAEIQQAYRDGIEITGDCRSFARQSGATLSRTKLFDVPKDEPAKGESGESKDSKQKPANATTEKVTKDVVTAFLEDLRCTVLCAPPRTGKGVVAAGIMIGFKSMYPAGKLFSCTIKQFKGEDWYFAPSDYHINPDRRNPVALAITLYELYRAWESSNSTADAPSLLVIDEIRDTLLAIDNVKTEEVDPDLAQIHPKFADWFRGEVISAATMNQCHRRYVLLMSPVSTSTAMGFKDANSLNSYASFTLVTPSELAFTEGNNGTFAAPAIRSDSPLFDGFYGLAWSKKSKQWLGIPKIDNEVIKLRESQEVKLNYFAPSLTESFIPIPPPSSNPFTIPIEAQNMASTATMQPETILEQDDSDFMEIVESAIYIIGLSDKPVTLTRLIPQSRQRTKYRDRLIEALSAMPEIEYYSRKNGNVISHFFEQKKEGADDESFVDQLLIDDDEQP